MHPHLLVTAEKRGALRSLQDVRSTLTGGHPGQIWKDLLDRAESDLTVAPYTPASRLPHRAPGQAEAENRDYVIVDATATRIKRAALAHLLGGDLRFRDEALRQLTCIFDTKAWPDWRDLAHLQHPADLRTGQLMRAIGLAYDWLAPSLSAAERRWIVAGLDRRAIQPYLASLSARASWAFSAVPNNWMTCIVGGAGVAGMALGADHPDSRRLIEEAVGRFQAYLNVLGPEGEFNESIGYAGSMRFPVEFFHLYGYWQGRPADELLDGRLSRFCDWYLYFILPPGVNAAFGDTHTGAPPCVTMFATMAAATRNPVYQWFYEQYRRKAAQRDLCDELLSYDPTVPVVPPTGRLPLGRGFRGHSACWSSRTDWSPDSTPCVVYGKGGHGSEGHGHHDVGNLCLDGYTQPLIIDSGVPQYPADFFGPNRYRYYTAAAWGHNVPVPGGREMRVGSTHAAHILAMDFDETRGAVWLADTTALYDGVRRMRRGVIHLLPGIIAVLDRYESNDEDDLSMRWHTSRPVAPSPDGAFEVLNGDARLRAQMACLNGQAVLFRCGAHAYQAPFDRDRLNNPLPQKHESYVEARARARQLSLLTLFSVSHASRPPTQWVQTEKGWTIESPTGCVHVTGGEMQLVVAAQGHAIRLDLLAGTGSLT
jgi:hypothetical protein